MASDLLNKLKSNATRLNNDVQRTVNPVGKLVGNYTVKDRLNVVSSGEADLYICQELSSQEECVLKLYRRSDAIKSEVLDLLKSIKNSNVATILASGFYESFPYVIMPKLKYSLDMRLKKGETIPLNELKSTVIPSIINGLQELHKQGILHKDLKPSNIMLDNLGNLVIIDFGISTATNGQTVVVTNAGMSSIYLAPEAFSNSYLKETDYYALGITLYELYTGKTPYESLDNTLAVSYASVQKIPFTEDFPVELKELILGLTYKDISNREDLNNPNRRWGYREVQNWLKGEKQPIPGCVEIPKNQNTVFPYKFKNEKYTDNSKLIEALLANWSEGIKEVGRGLLSKHYDINNDAKKTALCNEAEDQLAKEQNNTYIIFWRLMYKLEPKINGLWWKNAHYSDLNELAERIIESKEESDPILEKFVDMFTQEVLISYALYSGNKTQVEYLRNISRNINSFKNSSIKERWELMINISYALTNSKNFIFNGKKYDNVYELVKSLDRLYLYSMDEFIKIYYGVQSSLRLVAKFLRGSEERALNNYVASRKTTINLANGNYCFINWKEFNKYINMLWDNDNLVDLYEFDRKCRPELIKIKIESDELDEARIRRSPKIEEDLISEIINDVFAFWGMILRGIGKIFLKKEVKTEKSENDRIKYAYIKLYFNKTDALIQIDEYFFKNIKALVSFINTMKNMNGGLFNSFVRVHKNAIEQLISCQATQELKDKLSELFSEV